MNILILGARGMLGQELVRVFSHNAPIPPLSLRGGEGELLAWDRDELDITDPIEVQQKIEKHFLIRSDQKVSTPTLIINAAAYNAVDEAEKNPEIANRVNGDAVGYLAKAAANIGATFVHYSSDYVFDGTKKEGYREDDVPNPISKYGASKLLGEKKLGNWETGKLFLIRTSRLFGREGGGKRSFVDTMLALAKTKERLEIVDEEIASPTYATDLAARTHAIIDGGHPSGVYHVTNSGACTWYTFAQEIFKQAHERSLIEKIPQLIPVPSSKFPRPAQRPAYSQLLSTKLPQLRPWQEALSAYLKTCNETIHDER